MRENRMNLNKEFDESLTDKEYGERLKECITNADMTQKQVADKAGFTQQYISNIIRGLKPMTITAARSLSKVLHVREEYLLCEDDYLTERDMWDKRRNLLEQSDSIALQLLSLAGYEPICDFVSNWKKLGLDKTIYGPFKKGDYAGKHIPDEYDSKTIMMTEIQAPNGKKFYCDSEDLYLLNYELIDYINLRMTQLESKFAWRYDDAQIDIKSPGSETTFYERKNSMENPDLIAGSIWIDHDYDFFPDIEQIEKFHDSLETQGK